MTTSVRASVECEDEGESESAGEGEGAGAGGGRARARVRVRVRARAPLAAISMLIDDATDDAVLASTSLVPRRRSLEVSALMSFGEFGDRPVGMTSQSSLNAGSSWH